MTEKRPQVDQWVTHHQQATPIVHAADAALASTFGTLPDFAVPDRDEWKRAART